MSGCQLDDAAMRALGYTNVDAAPGELLVDKDGYARREAEAAAAMARMQAMMMEATPEKLEADAKAEQEAVNQRALMLRQQSWDAGLGGGRTPSPTPRTEDMYQVAPS